MSTQLFNVITRFNFTLNRYEEINVLGMMLNTRLKSIRNYTTYSYSKYMTDGPMVLRSVRPKSPLLFYKATTSAMRSMNHRLFYVNLIFLSAAYDLISNFVDL